MLTLRFFVLTLIFDSIFVVINSTRQGRYCYISNTREIGRCQLITNCPNTISNIKRGNYPELCGFHGKIPIICCREFPVATTYSTVATTTSTIATTTSTYTATTTERHTPISEQKCLEYGKSIISDCGNRAIIGGGDLAEAIEFPHMALIGYGDSNDISWECGGSLISERFVLTAAHCIQNKKKQSAQWVRLGDLNIKDEIDDAEPEEFTVIQGIKHPDYLPLLRYNDIALLKLERNVKFNEYIRPACLQSKHDIIEKKAIATGWGNLEFSGYPSDDLRKVTLSIIDHENCNNSYRLYLSNRTLTNGIIDNLQICAGGYKETKDTCQGDSGGPLQVYNPDLYCMYNIIGVTSFGKVCGVVNSPGVYTRVSFYVPWIESIVWPNN